MPDSGRLAALQDVQGRKLLKTRLNIGEMFGDAEKSYRQVSSSVVSTLWYDFVEDLGLGLPPAEQVPQLK